jgi:hypothetical protein
MSHSCHAGFLFPVFPGISLSLSIAISGSSWINFARVWGAAFQTGFPATMLQKPSLIESSPKIVIKIHVQLNSSLL